MEKITLQQNGSSATIQLKGAELSSLQTEGLEYIWNADPSVWKRHAPVLFPIVGRLKDNYYTYDQKDYSLPQHGFARDCNFKLIEHLGHKASLELKSDDSTLENFPFEFQLVITYSLSASQLSVTYRVENPSKTDDLYFSIGAHPGFNCPLIPNSENFSDYVLDFGDNSLQSLEIWNLKDGLITNNKEQLPLKDGRISLDYSLFENDALIFSTDKAKNLSFKSTVSGKGVNMKFPDFDWVGVWTKGKSAPFLCLEPWCGIADTVDHDHELTNKLGINCLKPLGKFSRSFDMRFI